MTRFQPGTQWTNAIIRPNCPKCRTRMMLARIEPDAPGQEKRTFECPKCEKEIEEIAKLS